MASLVEYADNYLTVFEVGDAAEKQRHAERLYEAANKIATQVGASDFVSLIDGGDTEAIGSAAVMSA